MKLVSAQVLKFRNILDSTPVTIQSDVTCLVGKNESGKTSFLHALYRLNPARSNVKFSIPDQYPAWLEKRDRREGIKLEEVHPINVIFEMDTQDTKSVEQRFGPLTFRSARLLLCRNYTGQLTYEFDVDEAAAVKHMVATMSLPQSVSNDVSQCKTFKVMTNIATALQDDSEEEKSKAGVVIEAKVRALLGDADFEAAIWNLLAPRIPEFFYYSEYSKLPYSVNVREVMETADESLKDSELTAKALLRLAGAEEEYLLNPDYERRKRELENVANALTEDVLHYWTQNSDLRVQPDITQRTESTPKGHTSVIDQLKIRIWDNRHLLSLPFDEHSTGFQWFFSFLAAFAEYEHKNPPMVILLDEPALGLHAKAQSDYLRFIDERLSKRCQVIYTTHSPFMIQPSRLERVRIVEDRGRDIGTKVVEDVLTTDPDTLFPLQGALGYDLVQHLLISQDNLIVEGTSDFTYLIVISDHLKSLGRTHLNKRWSIIPVAGADMIPTFVALLGGHLGMTVLIDSRKAGHQRLSQLAAQGYLKGKRLITIGEVIGRSLADIEDVFAIEDYLQIYNTAFGSSLLASDLVGTDPIVNRIARHIGIDRFDHGLPADILLRNRAELLSRFSSHTLDQFEKLFERINMTLPEFNESNSSIKGRTIGA